MGGSSRSQLGVMRCDGRAAFCWLTGGGGCGCGCSAGGRTTRRWPVIQASSGKGSERGLALRGGDWGARRGSGAGGYGSDGGAGCEGGSDHAGGGVNVAAALCWPVAAKGAGVG